MRIEIVKKQPKKTRENVAKTGEQYRIINCDNQERSCIMDGKQIAASGALHLIPLDNINGYDVRPGFYEISGATALREGVNFTVCSLEASSVELLLYHRGDKEPYAALPFPKHYRIGSVYSMLVFGLDIYDFEYAYRVDGLHDPEKGLIFDKTKPLLDPYAKAVTGQSVWGEQPNQNHDYHASLQRTLLSVFLIRELLRGSVRKSLI